jgi:PAS domain S-box-containing protein
VRARHATHRERYFTEARAREMGSGLVLHGRRKNGTEFPVEISLGPIETSAGRLFAGAIRDITERQRADEQRFRLAALVAGSDDAIIGKTLAGIITSWNAGAERLFGYSEQEIIGQSILRLVPPERVGEEQEILRRLATGNVERFDTVRLHKAGHPVHLSVTSSPIRDSSGNLLGVAKVARDISERRRAELALANAKDTAESASRELEAFSYSVAHDLRAPLRGMSGFSQILLDQYQDKLDADGQDALREIMLNARRMGALIDALLSLARLTRSQLRREPVDLSAVAREVGARLSAAETGRAVALSVEPGLGADVDPVLLRALFDNLLGNAWKFSGKTLTPCVAFGATQRDDVRTFYVRDNGAGFDMAFANKLFGPFQRLHTQEEFPGTGIGLATVQRIVHRHGGKLWAEGKVDEGATFYFTLPSRLLEGEP